MKQKNILVYFLLLASIVCTLGPAGAGLKPQPQVIPEQASCGVCGMYPARFPQWQTQIIFADGTMVPFDGAKDMFKYLLNISEYNKQQKRADVVAIWVRDHLDGAWLDGETAFYVVGSSAVGPMGQELVPFADVAVAREFQGKNGGTVKLFAEINVEVIQKLGMGGMKMGGQHRGGM